MIRVNSCSEYSDIWEVFPQSHLEILSTLHPHLYIFSYMHWFKKLGIPVTRISTIPCSVLYTKIDSNETIAISIAINKLKAIHKGPSKITPDIRSIPAVSSKVSTKNFKRQSFVLLK